ncbi:MAG: Fic family protein [Pseudomonadales bacterium]|nr:Fic family protein [Pseudomonadales bacterium]
MIKSDAIQINPEILKLIAAIDEFKGAWHAQSSPAPAVMAALRMSATAASIGASTRMEGGELDDSEVERLLAGAHTDSLSRELSAHATLLEVVHNSWGKIPFTGAHLKQMHRILFHHSEQDAGHRGTFKNIDVNAPMRELLAWHREASEAEELHPLLVIAVCLAAFLKITPFTAGNIRLAGVITSLLLLRAGYTFAPYVSVDRIMEKKRDMAMLVLWQTQADMEKGDANWQPWLLFFLSSLREVTRDLNQQVSQQNQTPAVLPTLSQQIVALANERGRITIGDVIKFTGTSRNTLKQHFRYLVARGYLHQYGGGRGVWYQPVMPNETFLRQA